jgi:hypothetical protein
MENEVEEIKKTLVDAPVEEIKSIISKLYIDDLTKQQVEDYCDEHSYEFSNTDIFKYLKREWINEVFSLGRQSEEFQTILSHPSSHFYAWTVERVKNPFSVSSRIVHKLSKKYGFEFVSMMEKIRWKQEISWARKMRSDHDKVVCILSAIFLISAKKNPNKYFEYITDTAFDILEDENFFENDMLNMREDEILSSDFSSHDWTPIFLRFSKKHFESIISKMSDQKIEFAAKKACEDFANERYFEDLDKNLNLVNRFPLSSRLLVAMRARKMDITSNELVECEKQFKNDLKNKKYIQDINKTIDQDFISWLRTAPIKEVILDRKQKKQFKQNVSIINSYWIDNLPSDLKDLGGEGREIFSKWRSQVLSEQREPPIDPVTDYLFYLIEEG